MTAKIPERRIPSTPAARRAWIRLRLAERGISLRQLAEREGYSYTCLRQAMIKRKPKAEGIIAKAVGVSPQRIWPERYQAKEKRVNAHMERAA